MKTVPPLPGGSSESFPAVLAKFHGRWRVWLLVAGLLRTLSWAGLVLLGLGALDALAAFSDAGLRVAGGLLLAVIFGGVLVTLIEVYLFGAEEAATAADQILNSERRAVLSALEVNRKSGGNLPFAKWLEARTVEDGLGLLKKISGAASRPSGAIRQALKRFGLAMLPIILLAIIFPGPCWIVVRRILFPGAGIPPWSRLVFAIEPNPATVLYGGDLVVSVNVTGGKWTGPVRMLARNARSGKVEDSRAYQESATRYSQRLERVTENLEVAFVAGRARSNWMRVEVLMQPKVNGVHLTVAPPAYTGKPAVNFPLGTQPLAPIAGSHVEAIIGSNRPLKGGKLLIESQDGKGPREISGQIAGPASVRFAWSAAQPSKLRFALEDVLGTKSEPLTVEQKITPDDRPLVRLQEPAGDVLATPSSVVPVSAIAQDDFGLTRVSCIRRLDAFKERATDEPLTQGARDFTLSGIMRMAALNVAPGQTVEMHLEAADSNPNLLGLGASDTSRIHIISEEKYAEILRDQTTLDDFIGRYNALKEAWQAAAKALADLEEAAKSGDREKIEKARQNALKAHQDAAKLMGQIAKDFPIFDLDASLAETASQAMQQLYDNAQQLENIQGANAHSLQQAIEQMKNRVASVDKKVTQELSSGQKAAKAAEVFSSMGEFKELVQKQKELAKDFNRVAEQVRRGETAGRDALEQLAREQRDNQKAMEEFSEKLSGELKELGSDYDKLREGGEKFLEAFKDLKIPGVMGEAADAAKKSDSRTGSDRASEALALLESLIRKDNCLSGMCRGEKPGFPWPQDLSSTLEQLMRSLVTKRGNGQGNNPGEQPGSGNGGVSDITDSGYLSKGKTTRLPIYGPPKLHFPSSQQGGSGYGTGKTGNPDNHAIAESRVSNTVHDNSAGTATATEAVPEPYRDAVRKYFMPEPDNTKPGTQNR